MKFLVPVIGLLIMQSLHAQTVATIQAPTMRYKLTSPEGWYFYQTMNETGRIALLIPEGEDRVTGKHFIYALDVEYDSGYATVEEVLQGDLNGENTSEQDIRVLHDSTINIYGNIKARIIYFSPFIIEGETNWQANAYIDAGTGCLKISLATNSEKSFLQYLPDFEFVVHSYVFLESWGKRD